MCAPSSGRINLCQPRIRRRLHTDERQFCRRRFCARSFERQQRALSFQAAGVTGEAAVRADDAVTGNDDADRVAAGGGARGARAAGISRPVRQIAVSAGRADSDARDCSPYRALKRRAFRRERCLKTPAFSREVLSQLVPGLAQDRVVRVRPPSGFDPWMILLTVEVSARESVATGDKQYAAVRTFIEIVVAHIHSFMWLLFVTRGLCHRCMTA